MNGSASSRETRGSQAMMRPEGKRTVPTSITVTGIPDTLGCVKYESRSMPQARESLMSSYMLSHVPSGSSGLSLDSTGDQPPSRSTVNDLPLGRR